MAKANKKANRAETKRKVTSQNLPATTGTTVQRLIERQPAWTPFRVGVAQDVIQQPEPTFSAITVWLNSRYQVLMREPGEFAPFGRVVWLSIKRLDRQPVRSWRDLQRIKNELVGEQFDAVEVFPAEDKLVDAANQYHLWAFRSSYRLPFGFRERKVLEEGDHELHNQGLATQNPLGQS